MSESLNSSSDLDIGLENEDLTNKTNFLPLQFTCEICNAKFKTGSQFKVHCLTKHNIDAPFRCEVCSRTYKLLNTLRCHQKTSHSNVRHTCEICNVSFTTNFSLKTHKLRYGKAIFACSVCEKGFRVKSDLTMHMKCHQEASFKCSVCDKTFTRKCNLARHMRFHSDTVEPLKCSYCEKTFVRTENHRQHERTHTNERPFKCEICDKAFASSSNYSRHKREHSKKTAPVTKKKKVVGDDILCLSRVAKDKLGNKSVNKNHKGNVIKLENVEENCENNHILIESKPKNSIKSQQREEGKDVKTDSSNTESSWLNQVGNETLFMLEQFDSDQQFLFEQNMFVPALFAPLEYNSINNEQTLDNNQLIDTSKYINDEYLKKPGQCNT